ncbi:hypothetical protein BKA69DRAFT_1166632 [Paraphysoderma sedebokerense]|nr:hypothetical protein BKA69DRAFT_1166632 [Paraphysoderma sedebokerense]
MSSSAAPTFASIEEELSYYKSKYNETIVNLEQTKLAFDEFQADSKDLETELENEIERLEKSVEDYKSKNESLNRDMEEWKNRYHSSKRESDDTITKLQSELNTIKAEFGELKIRIRDIEQENEELDKLQRISESNAQDLESKYNKALEKIAFLESELDEKVKLEEDSQRLRDELRDLQHELSVRLDNNTILDSSTLPNPTTSSPSPRQYSLPQESHEPVDTVMSEAGEEQSSSSRSSSIPKLQNMKIIQDMLTRVKSLESRLATCRHIISPYLPSTPSISRQQSVDSLVPNPEVTNLEEAGGKDAESIAQS